MMLARFRTAHDELAAKELLVVQLFYGALGLVDRQHLDESEALRTLVVFVGHYFGVLDRADPIEELEEIALRRVE